jgi:hypothetical protein
MTKQVVLFAGLILSGVLAVTAGCGGDDTTTTGSGGAGGDPSASSSTGSGPASSSSGMGGSGGGAALTCDAYCTTIMAGCTADNAQYPDNASCLASCAGFPVGTDADMSGNTLGCRSYHAGVADDSATNATAHCHHAGPGGGDGTCGENCDGFCAVAMQVCTGANEQWATADECRVDCTAFMYDMANTFDTTDTSGDSFNCRLYHLTNAARDAMSAGTHCPHIITASPVCM